MTATVLVPLDGSAKDERAFPIAMNFAQLADAGLHLIHVVDTSADESASSGPQTTSERREVLEQILREAAERLETDVAQSVGWEVIDGPDVTAALLGRIAAMSPVLVVMATRAPGPIGRAIHGSVADEIVRKSSRPVILVPPGADYLRGKHVHLRRVLVPLDGSDAALEALTLLLSFPRATELELVLLEVVSPDPDHLAAEAAERRLEAVAVRARASGATVEVRIVEADAPVDVIVGAIRQDLVDVITMTTHGGSGLERAVLGSVATGVVRKSEVPVILVART